MRKMAPIRPFYFVCSLAPLNTTQFTHIHTHTRTAPQPNSDVCCVINLFISVNICAFSGRQCTISAQQIHWKFVTKCFSDRSIFTFVFGTRDTFVCRKVLWVTFSLSLDERGKKIRFFARAYLHVIQPTWSCMQLAVERQLHAVYRNTIVVAWQSMSKKHIQIVVTSTLHFGQCNETQFVFV